MLLGLDRALGREAEADELGRDALAERRLGEEEEVVGAAPQDGQRRDQPCLAVSSSAWQASPGASASTSFETMRWRYDAASLPVTPT